MLYQSAIFLAFFLAFILVTKKHKRDADFVLVAWLGLIGFHLFAFYLLYTHQDISFPGLIAAGFPLPLVHGPLLYLYTRLETSGERFTKKQLLHFLPVLMSYLMFTPFYVLPLQQQVDVFKQKGQGFEVQVLINLIAIYVSGVVYISLSLVTLLRYRRNLVNQFSNTEKVNFKWLLYLIGWMVVIWIMVLVVHEDKLIFGAAALFVLWLGYFGIRQVQIFHHNAPQQLLQQQLPVSKIEIIDSHIADATNDANAEPTAEAAETTNIKYQKSTLSDIDATAIHERLKALMDEQKLFTNPDLTLNDLAKSLNVHPNHLSQVINSKENKSFYDLVNEKRIEEFTRLISQPSQQQYTLVSIAYDCGFNSKASFNRNFKKYTGLTPTEYVKGLRQQVA